MRRLTAPSLMLSLAVCGTLSLSACGTAVPAIPTAAPAPSVSEVPTLTCGSGPVGITRLPDGLTRTGAFTRLASLTKRLKVQGWAWKGGGEEVRVGVVCGVRSAEVFATLVRRSSLGAYHGKPALRWRTSGGTRAFMWLERPGTAVFVTATPGLAAELNRIVGGVTPLS
ncbi:hypothetical protein ABZ297_44345 [Nonomuraea sp. NPDC005983]|uniref:hypothetical protein n=1 Tax=Nonomuraea sp. NPDC005983 TaxID=3155595 RepID=UPI0033A2BEF8